MQVYLSWSELASYKGVEVMLQAIATLKRPGYELHRSCYPLFQLTETLVRFYDALGDYPRALIQGREHLHALKSLLQPLSSAIITAELALVRFTRINLRVAGGPGGDSSLTGQLTLVGKMCEARSFAGEAQDHARLLWGGVGSYVLEQWNLSNSELEREIHVRLMILLSEFRNSLQLADAKQAWDDLD